MEVTITTKFAKGDRVWMPDGQGHKIKGKVVKIVLFLADLTDNPGRIVASSVNYHCIDEQRQPHVLHEYQLEPRTINR